MTVWALIVHQINWLTFKRKLPRKLKLIYPKCYKFALLRKVPFIQDRVKTDTRKCVTVKVSIWKEGKHKVVVTHIKLLEWDTLWNVNVGKVRENAEIRLNESIATNSFTKVISFWTESRCYMSVIKVHFQW